LPFSIFNIEVHGPPKLLWAPEQRFDRETPATVKH